MSTQPQAVPLWLDCDPGHDVRIKQSQDAAPAVYATPGVSALLGEGDGSWLMDAEPHRGR